MAPAGAGYDDEMDDFIELDPEEQAIQDAHKAAGRKTGKSTGGSTLKTALRGITKESWEEVAAIFGTGDEYAWASTPSLSPLGGQLTSMAQWSWMRRTRPSQIPTSKTFVSCPATQSASDGSLQVFEPAIIKERMMTDEDEKVRHYDVPERMQMLAVRTLGSQTAYCRTQLLLSSHDLDAAALWIAPKIDPKLTEEYLLLDMQGNPRSRLYEPFMAAIKRTLDEMHVKSREVPFIWMHRRDYLMAVDANGSNKNLMERPHLWRIQALSYEYRSFVDRRMAVERLWHRLGMPEDPYFADYHPRLQTVEEVADLSDWINTRFCKELRQVRQAEEDYASTQGLEEGAAQRVKRASRLTSYERAKDSYVAALAAVSRPSFSTSGDRRAHRRKWRSSRAH
jgi:transcription elongation factor SPT6